MEKPQLAQFGLTPEQYRDASESQQKRSSNMKFMWGFAIVLGLAGILQGGPPEVALFMLLLGLFWGFVFDFPRRFRPSARLVPAAVAFDQANAAYTIWLREQERLRAAAAAEAERAERRLQETFWRGLSGPQFEQETAALLRMLGHVVTVVGGAGDQGIDLTIDNNTVVQCKAHNRPLVPATVREFLGAVTAAKAQRGILITLVGCTAEASRFASQAGIEVWDMTHLIALQRNIRAPRPLPAQAATGPHNNRMQPAPPPPGECPARC